MSSVVFCDSKCHGDCRRLSRFIIKLTLVDHSIFKYVYCVNVTVKELKLFGIRTFAHQGICFVCCFHCLFSEMLNILHIGVQLGGENEATLKYADDLVIIASSRAVPHSLCLFIWGFLCCFQHCTGHITTGSWKGRGNQYIQLVRVLSLT